MESSIKQKLIIPMLINIGFVALGISTTLKGIDQHQTWRIVLASVSTTLFAAGIILMILAIRKENKVIKAIESPKSY